MEYSGRIQPTANKELEGIVSYLLSFGPNSVQSFLDAWQHTLVELQENVVEHRLFRFPVLARLDYHTVLVNDHVVLYFKENNRI